MVISRDLTAQSLCTEATPAVFEVPAVCHAGWCLAPALSQVSGACLHPAPAGGRSPDTECRNAQSQLGLDAGPELIKFLGTQSMGVTLPGSGFVWSLCHFPQCSCLWSAIQKQLKWLTLDWKKDFTVKLKKRCCLIFKPTMSLEV